MPVKGSPGKKRARRRSRYIRAEKVTSQLATSGSQLAERVGGRRIVADMAENFGTGDYTIRTGRFSTRRSPIRSNSQRRQRDFFLLCESAAARKKDRNASVPHLAARGNEAIPLAERQTMLPSYPALDTRTKRIRKSGYRASDVTRIPVSDHYRLLPLALVFMDSAVLFVFDVRPVQMGS